MQGGTNACAVTIPGFTSQVLDSHSVMIPGMESGKVVRDLRQGKVSARCLACGVQRCGVRPQGLTSEVLTGRPQATVS